MRVLVNGYSPEVREAQIGSLFYDVLIPHSEVCMHMRVAGKRMAVQIVGSGRLDGSWSERPMAQLLEERDDRSVGKFVPFSAPILLGEAGIIPVPPHPTDWPNQLD